MLSIGWVLRLQPRVLHRLEERPKHSRVSILDGVRLVESDRIDAMRVLIADVP